MLTCLQCGEAFPEDQEPAASISGSLTGDECSESYFLCGRCSSYTVLVSWDLFLDEEQVSTRGPLSNGEGGKKVELIRQCAEPWDKKCRCAAHSAYFEGMLD